jgi:hypothetical protein
MDTSVKRLLAAGIVIALVLAGLVSYYASSKPDGLNKVAADHRMNRKERTSPADGSPVSGYGVKGVKDGRLSDGLAGVIGVGVTLAIGGGVFWTVRRRRAPRREEP